MIAYHPMYPKLILRMVSIMGPKGMAAFAKDAGVSAEQLQQFEKSKNIDPIAEHIPVMWTKLFADSTPLQALAIVETIEKG